MKKVMVKWMIATLVLATSFSLTTAQAQGSVSFGVFYDELQPHGRWITHASYGNVWIPRVDRDFTPYATNGYWINTEYGNTWVSDYTWGWAPFHYGRWFYDDFYGWAWVPGSEWAPAWVAWRSGGGYYGWAPLMPGLSISVSYNYYNTIPHRYWSFVPYRYITYRTVHHHCVPRTQVVNIINRTTVVTHNHYDSRRRSTYFTGPSRHEMERESRSRVEVYKVNDRNRPGRSDIDRGTVSFYKPEVERDERTRPAHVKSNNDWMESRHDRNEFNGSKPDRLDHKKFDDAKRDQPVEHRKESQSFDRRHESMKQYERPGELHEKKQESRQPSYDFKKPESQRRSTPNTNHSVERRSGNQEHVQRDRSSQPGSQPRVQRESKPQGSMNPQRKSSGDFDKSSRSPSRKRD